MGVLLAEARSQVGLDRDIVRAQSRQAQTQTMMRLMTRHGRALASY
ncbi:hypothetical protein [Pantoea ananatis]